MFSDAPTMDPIGEVKIVISALFNASLPNIRDDEYVIQRIQRFGNIQLLIIEIAAI